MKRLIAPFLLLAVLMGGCQSHPTPQAVAYDTLRASLTVMETKMQLFNLEVNNGHVSPAKEREVREKYVAALKAVKAAAQVASAGLDASTPVEVNALVQSFLTIVTTVIPPRN